MPLSRSLETGCSLQSLGRIVPSPHPDYLHALLSKDATCYGLFHSDVTKNPKSSSSELPVQYLPQWRIDKVVIASLKADGQSSERCQDTNYLQDRESRTQILRSIQHSVTQKYGRLKEIVEEWLTGDLLEKRLRQQDERQLIRIDANLVSNAGGFVMQSYWRDKIGWGGSKLEKQVEHARSKKYFVEVPLKASELGVNIFSMQKQRMKRFVWDFENGRWTRAANCSIAKGNKHAQRMKTLESEIRMFEKARNKALQENRLGYVVNLKDDGSINYADTNHEPDDHENSCLQTPEKEATTSALVPVDEQPQITTPSTLHASNKLGINGSPRKVVKWSAPERNRIRKKPSQARRHRFMRALNQSRK